MLALGATIALSACARAPAQTPVPGDVAVAAQLEQAFRLAPGEDAWLADEGVRVVFRDVYSDSRCPSDVQCPWAGDAVVSVRLEWSGAVEDVALHTPQQPSAARAGPYLVELVALDPQPSAERPIEIPDYRATLRVRRPD